MEKLNYRKIEARYIVIIVLILISALMMYDIIHAYKFDRYALLLGIYIDVPLGISSILFSLFVKKIEQNRTTLKSFLTTTGILFGLLMPLMSTALYLLG